MGKIPYHLNMTKEELIEARRKRGLSQGQMADLVGYKGKHGWREIARLESGSRPIPERIALRLKIMDMEREKDG